MDHAVIEPGVGTWVVDGLGHPHRPGQGGREKLMLLNFYITFFSSVELEIILLGI